MNKHNARVRRGARTKIIQQKNDLPIAVVSRSQKNISLQLVRYNEKGNQVITSCSTLDKELKTLSGTKVDKSFEVGKKFGERAKALGVEKIAFDRSGYKYHGRVKALADGAREAGLVF